MVNRICTWIADCDSNWCQCSNSQIEMIRNRDHGAAGENDTVRDGTPDDGSERLLRSHRNAPNPSGKYQKLSVDSARNCSSQYSNSESGSSSAGLIKASTSSSQGSSTTSGGTQHIRGGGQTTQPEVLEPTSLTFWAGDICSRGGLPMLTSNEIETMIGGPIAEAQTDLKGGFGKVFKCYHSRHGRVAIKIMKDMDDTKSFKDEISALLRLRHDAIVVVKAMCLSPMAIALEWMEGGSLQTAVEEKSLTELGSVLTILQDVAKGLEYIHCGNMVYRDIKPRECLRDLADLRFAMGCIADCAVPARHNNVYGIALVVQD